MGTRHLIAVYLGGTHKIAQYGQWDGYPSGQGKTILKFLAETDLEAFEKKVVALRYMTDAQIDAANATMKKIGGDAYMKKNPWMSRDAGAKILTYVLEQPKGLLLNNQITFAADGLFCEFAYVIDLDNSQFEFYKGFQKEKPGTPGRFDDLDDGGEYRPVRLVGKWPLRGLPTVADLDAALDEGDDGNQDDQEILADQAAVG